MDPISDMFSSIKNAQAVHHQTVDVPFSNLKLEIIQILVKENFISEFKKLKRNKFRVLRVYLKYNKDGSGAISSLKRISKSSRRVYRKVNEIKKIRGGYGMGIISTSKGLMTLKKAREQKLGGEIICEIW